MTILYWTLDKTRLLASYKIGSGIECLSVAPFISERSKSFSVIGDKLFRLFTVKDEEGVTSLQLDSEEVKGLPSGLSTVTAPFR